MISDTHDDAVILLAKASPDDVSDVLSSLLQTDEATGVSLLADINPRNNSATRSG